MDRSAKGFQHVRVRAMSGYDRAPANWSESLDCFLDEVIAYPNLRTVAFYLPHGNCARFFGALDYAHSMLPNVDRIETYVGDNPSTFYFLKRGKWEACWGGTKTAICDVGAKASQPIDTPKPVACSKSVTRPRPGTAADKCWAVFDSLAAERGEFAVSDAREALRDQPIADSTIGVILGQWRKFNGVVVRRGITPKKKPLSP